MIYLQLLWAFFQIGLFSIGGGYAAMPLIQAQTVTQYAWLTVEEFTDLVTIAEMTPGPIAVNAATFVGMRVAGFGGALVATLGCIVPALILVTLLAILYTRYRKMSALQTVLQTVRPVVLALIASAGVTILASALSLADGKIEHMLFTVGAAVLFLLAFFVLRKWKPSPIFVMLACGVVGGLLYACTVPVT